ncbi:MAG: PilZ domain-containing protein [Bdellovibrionia bacterium]
MTTGKPAPRTPLSLEVNFKRSYARSETLGSLRNISLTGAFLAVESTELKANEKLQLRFVVSGRERVIGATVVWKNSAGCGVKFHHSNNRDRQIIDDLIYFVESSRESRRSVIDDIFKKVA